MGSSVDAIGRRGITGDSYYVHNQAPTFSCMPVSTVTCQPVAQHCVMNEPFLEPVYTRSSYTTDILPINTFAMKSRGPTRTAEVDNLMLNDARSNDLGTGILPYEIPIPMRHKHYSHSNERVIRHRAAPIYPVAEETIIREPGHTYTGTLGHTGGSVLNEGYVSRPLV